MSQQLRLAASARTLHGFHKATCAYQRVYSDPSTRMNAICVVSEGIRAIGTRPDLTSQVAEATFANAFSESANHDSFSETDCSPKKLVTEALQKAATRAEAAIFSLKQNIPLGSFESSSITCACVVGQYAYIANAGICRTYHLRANHLKQITRDHAVRNHIVLRALGDPSWEFGKELQPIELDIFTQPLEPSDQFLLCSRDIWRSLSDDILQQILSEADQINVATERLVEAAKQEDYSRELSVVVMSVVG